MSPEQIISEMKSRYGEWLETAGDESPALLIRILAYNLSKERQKTELLEKILKNEYARHDYTKHC